MKIPYRRQRLTRSRLITTLLGMFVLLLLLAVVSLGVGPAGIPLTKMASELFSSGDDSVRSILLDLRLPRILLAMSVGAALASCGVLFQALLRNPLADPYTLGVANGCAVGAVLGFLAGGNPLVVTFFSFTCGSLVILTVLAISRGTFGVRSESMLLGGVMVGAICAALLFLLLHFMGDELRSAVQWMLGDLSSVSPSLGYWSIALLGGLFIVSLFAGGMFNALALGDEEAASLGINVRIAKPVAYLSASFVIGLAVSFCGAIGFVGLVVPHILRRLIGADHRALLPASVLGGAIFLLLCDTIARSLMSLFESAASELPVGAVTALIGAPVFIALLRRGAAE